jgi:replicative DNA helicase
MAQNFKEKIVMKFQMSQLERTIVALLNNGHNKVFAGNVKRLFEMFQEQSYKNDYEKEVRVYIIKKIADTIITRDISNREAILSFLDFSGRHEAEAVQVVNNLYEYEIDEKELAMLDKEIIKQLKFSVLEEDSGVLSEMLTDLQTENYEDFDDFINKFEASLTGMGKKLKSAKESIEDSKQDVSLSSDQFVNVLSDMIEEDRNPSAKVLAGIRAINDAFNGGFEKGRVYLALGLAGGWKSGFLLNAALWAIKYNKFKTRNPKLRPVVVYLTMENSRNETIKRVWSHAFGNDNEMMNYEPAVAARMLAEQKLFRPNQPDMPELVIWHRSTKTINTADMSQMLDDLEKEGKECVFLVQDYIKRIRSTVNHKELRFELSYISDEFASIAKEREIPILTAMQLNRNAFREYESSNTMEGQIAAVDRMGASNVGESIDLIQNVDYAFILGRTQHAQSNEQGEIEYSDRYLVFKLIKARGKQPKITSFKHRFKDGNDMALIEDLNLPSSRSVITMQDVIKEKVSNAGGQQIRSTKRSI